MRISDWSSDVCSSDLLRNDNGPVFFSRSLPRPPTEEIQRKISGNAKASDQDQATKPPHRLKPASYHRASSFPRRRKSLFHPKFQIRKMSLVSMGDFHSPMQIKCRPSVSDRPHHQTCVGAAKAEAVVQYGLHLPLFGYMGNEIHASAILARVIQVKRWWHDQVAHRQHAEYGLDCARPSKQMADGR